VRRPAGVGSWPGRYDRAGRLGAGDQRQRHRVGLAFAVLQVHEVHADPAVAHEHLARRRDRVGPLGDDQFVRAAVP
jgi:hypothetical protein